MKKIYLFAFLVFSACLFSQNKKEKDSLLIIATKSSNDSVRIVAYNKLFFNEVFSNLEESRKYYEAIFAIAKTKKSDFAYAKAYNLKGVAYDISGKMDSSYLFYRKAIVYAKKCKALAVEGSALNNIGLLDWNKGNYYEALVNYNKALAIFEKNGNLEHQANALSNIGLIYDEIDDLKIAEIYLKKSFAIRSKLKDDYGLSVYYVNIAKIVQKQKKHRLAIENCEKAIKIKREINDLMGIAIADAIMSTSYLYLREFDRAYEILKQAEKICIENEAESNIIENVYAGLVEVYIEKNKLDLAKQYNQKLFEVNKKTNDVERLNWFYQFDSQIAVKEKNFEKAYLSDKKSDSLHKITNGIELKKAINLFEAKYQSEKKEKQLLLFKNELFKNEIETKRKNTWLLIISVITLFIAVLGYLLYSQQKLKNRQQEQEFQLKTAIKEIENQNKLQEQRLSISRDLHDNIGSQLTFIISSVDNVKYGFDINNEKLESKLSNISTFAKDTIIELRDTIWAMNSDQITFQDLENRINNYIEKAREAQENISFSFAIDDDLKTKILTAVEGINVYRTIQEAINNAIKYSGAQVISVNVRLQSEKIIIIIKDNGTGFNENEIEKGNGLNNMQKRIEEIGGKFALISTNEGTKIEIIIEG